jgi:hypothetical protein
MPTPTPIATLSLLPPLPPVPAAEVVATVVDGDDMVKEGVVADKERDVSDVVDEGDVEVEVDESLMLK